ncbi:amidohydrolase family protein [Sinomicrobium weinanense]|uniref:Amidohydrolase family protein n=1 Tax=Sinomicrobium weinanense TaxID=2842200 RepID=A0A926JRP4_9FLAO|nr:amidohydrolase family protein [Sinomicrobium weinanense]MBC9796262.1 amidohydrolase family protein [Sinomicrobium weinanense]MBU3122283.1 amidohydrolase family protein [Sinomicrobium weinanense]
MKKISLWIVAGLLCIACEKEVRPQFDIVIKDASIINTRTGEVTEGQSIGITGDTIKKIASSETAGKWKAAQTVNAGGKYVIPGLWDMHMHFGGGDTLVAENKNLLPLYIANGVTTIRDCAADISPAVLKWKKQVEEGTLAGPSIFTAGPKLEGKNSIWPGDLEIENEEELEKALDSLDKLQVDFVKITDNALSPELFMKSVKEATKRGYRTSGHIPFALTIKEVSDAGLSSVEHMGYMLKAASAKEEEIVSKVKEGTLDYGAAQSLLSESFDVEAAVEKYKKLDANGTVVLPTLIGSKIISYLDQDDHLSDPELSYIGPGLIKTYEWRIDRASKASKEDIEARHKRFEKLLSLIPIIQKSGMNIVAGTDAGFLNSYIYPGFALHEELEIYVDGGLTPLEALQTSVVNGPEFFDLSDYYGSIAEGKVADILLLNTNPVEDIKATRDIHTLIKKNKVYSKTDLDQLLEETAEKYKKEK